MTEPLDVLEARVRADLRALDQRISIERRAGRVVQDTTDWVAIRRLLGVPRANATPRSGMAAAVRAAGVPNLTALVRDVLRDGTQKPTYRIKREVREAASNLQREQGTGSAVVSISDQQVDNTLSRLARRGEVDHLSYGHYRATSTLKGGLTTP